MYDADGIPYSFCLIYHTFHSINSRKTRTHQKRYIIVRYAIEYVVHIWGSDQCYHPYSYINTLQWNRDKIKKYCTVQRRVHRMFRFKLIAYAHRIMSIWIILILLYANKSVANSFIICFFGVTEPLFPLDMIIW